MVMFMIYNKLSGFSDEISSDISVQFEVLNKLGIKYFEPRGIDGKNISELSEEEVLNLKEKMEMAGIKVSSVGSPVGKIKITDDFKEHFEMFKSVVKTAKVLGSKYIRIFSFYADGDWTTEKENEVFSRLEKMIAYAKENGVTLLHENEKDIFGDTKEKCLILAERLSCENFALVFDPANFVQCGENTIKAFELLKPYIEYLHIKDSKEDGTIVPAGEGEGNIDYILKELFKDGFDGFISLEPHLGTFEGLAALELDDKMLNLPKGGEGTFSLAFNKLNEIINNIKVINHENDISLIWGR